jgi:hypothetical protein
MEVVGLALRGAHLVVLSSVPLLLCLLVYELLPSASRIPSHLVLVPKEILSLLHPPEYRLFLLF